MDILLGANGKSYSSRHPGCADSPVSYRTNYVNMATRTGIFTLGYLLFGHERKPRL